MHAGMSICLFVCLWEMEREERSNRSSRASRMSCILFECFCACVRFSCRQATARGGHTALVCACVLEWGLEIWITHFFDGMGVCAWCVCHAYLLAYVCVDKRGCALDKMAIKCTLCQTWDSYSLCLSLSFLPSPCLTPSFSFSLAVSTYSVGGIASAGFAVGLACAIVPIMSAQDSGNAWSLYIYTFIHIHIHIHTYLQIWIPVGTHAIFTRM